MYWRVVIVAILLTGCELFPVAVDPETLPQPERPPVFEFSYVNSVTVAGWIRYRNHCSGIVSYEWHFGFYNPDGSEAISYSSAPKIQYPTNGTYNVLVKGIAYDSTKFHQMITVEVTNY